MLHVYDPNAGTCFDLSFNEMVPLERLTSVRLQSYVMFFEMHVIAKVLAGAPFLEDFGVNARQLVHYQKNAWNIGIPVLTRLRSIHLSLQERSEKVLAVLFEQIAFRHWNHYQRYSYGSHTNNDALALALALQRLLERSGMP